MAFSLSQVWCKKLCSTISGIGRSYVKMQPCNRYFQQSILTAGCVSQYQQGNQQPKSYLLNHGLVRSLLPVQYSTTSCQSSFVTHIPKQSLGGATHVAQPVMNVLQHIQYRNVTVEVLQEKPQIFVPDAQYQAKRTFLESEVVKFQKMAQDKSELYASQEAAQSFGYKDTLVPLPLISSFAISILSSSHRNLIVMSQHINILRPVHVGQTIAVIVHVENVVKGVKAGVAVRIFDNASGEQVGSGKLSVCALEEGQNRLDTTRRAGLV